MSKKTWIIFAAVCVAIIAGLVIVSNSNRIDVSGVKADAVLSASKQSGDIADRVYGKADSKVVFIEYGDYQCPGCRSAYEPVKEVVEQYKDKIAFVFRNYPLTSIHPNARAAAAAAESAGIQGKFWEMHDLLFTNQSSWKDLSTDERTTRFAEYATELGLNADTFKADLTAPSVSQKVNFDLALGKQIGVTGTPAFYFGNKKAENITDQTTNGIDKNKLKAELNKLLKENGIEPPKAE